MHSVEVLSKCDYGQNPGSLALDATHVYVAASERILSLPRAGGPPTVLVYDPGIVYVDLAVIDDEIYATTFTDLRVMPKTGGASKVIYKPSDPYAAIWGLTADDQAAYISEANVNTSNRIGSVERFEKVSHTRSEIGAGIGWPRDLVTDGTSVFIAAWDVGIVAVDKHGGQVRTVASAPGRLGGITLYGNDVFWMDRGGYPNEADAQIRKVPKGGGSPTNLLSVSKPAGPVAVWEGMLYAFVVQASGLPPQVPPQPTMRLVRASLADGSPEEMNWPGFAFDMTSTDNLVAAPDGLYTGNQDLVYRLPAP
jgi:hypothetical protein